MNIEYCKPIGYAWRTPKMPEPIIRTEENIWEKVCLMVCKRFKGVTLEQMKSKSKQREIFTCRAVCMTFLHSNNASLKTVGQYFGGRNHGTVHSAKVAIQDLIDTDKRFSSKYSEIKKEVEDFFLEQGYTDSLPVDNI